MMQILEVAASIRYLFEYFKDEPEPQDFLELDSHLKDFSDEERSLSWFVLPAHILNERFYYCNKDLEENEKIEIRQIKYLNNITLQDHRFIKRRTRPTLGFKCFHSASDTIEGIESVRMIQKGQITGQTKNSSSFRNFANLMVA